MSNDSSTTYFFHFNIFKSLDNESPILTIRSQAAKYHIIGVCTNFSAIKGLILPPYLGILATVLLPRLPLKAPPLRLRLWLVIDLRDSKDLAIEITPLAQSALRFYLIINTFKTKLLPVPQNETPEPLATA